jgi:hypothetical protein
MGRLDCTPDPIYSPNTYTLQAVAEQLPPALLDVAAAVAAQLPAGLRHWLAGLTVTMRPMELHAMVLAVFASFVAPFGEWLVRLHGMHVSLQPRRSLDVYAATDRHVHMHVCIVAMHHLACC